MANITRIKAKDSNPKKPKNQPKSKNQPKPNNTTKATPKKATPTTTSKTAKATASKSKGQKTKSTKAPMSKPLLVITWPFRMIAKPFVALGRYIRDSWHEIRQVRWPNRKATWKMTGAILIYAALIMTIILLLDALFTFIFNNILGS